MKRKDLRTKRERLINWLAENVIDCIQKEVNPNVTTSKLLAIIRRDANIDMSAKDFRAIMAECDLNCEHGCYTFTDEILNIGKAGYRKFIYEFYSKLADQPKPKPYVNKYGYGIATPQYSYPWERK